MYNQKTVHLVAECQCTDFYNLDQFYLFVYLLCKVSAPFLTSIQRYTPTGKLKHFCTGALIAPSLILTAAICLKRNTEEFVIVVGISNLADPVGQRRRIQSYEISTSPDPLRQQIAVARVYPPFLSDKNVKPIDVGLDFICGEIGINQYVYGSEAIEDTTFELQATDDFSNSYFEMSEDFIDFRHDCPVSFKKCRFLLL